jgi:hypothetical protein
VIFTNQNCDDDNKFSPGITGITGIPGIPV